MPADLQKLIDEEVARYQLRLAEGYEPRPWVLPEPSRELVGKLAALLGPQASAFEFGSGASTVVTQAK
jgi:hypothetical protein